MSLGREGFGLVPLLMGNQEQEPSFTQVLGPGVILAVVSNAYSLEGNVLNTGQDTERKKS